MHPQYARPHDSPDSHHAAEPPAAAASAQTDIGPIDIASPSTTPPKTAPSHTAPALSEGLRANTHGAPRAAGRGGSILPGIAVAALIVGGIGVFAYADWRAAHPLADVPDDVEPVLKVPGEVPRALRR